MERQKHTQKKFGPIFSDEFVCFSVLSSAKRKDALDHECIVDNPKIFVNFNKMKENGIRDTI